MFFTFFKGEKFKGQIFEMLWNCIREFFDYEKNEYIPYNDPRC